MKPFKDLSIRHKLTTFMMAGSIVTMLLAGGAFVVYDYFAFLQTTGDRLFTMTRIIGANSTAAIAFDDHKSAAEIVSVLRDEPHIIMACIYKADGQPFAMYRRETGALRECPQPLAEGEQRHGESVARLQRIMLHEEAIGWVFIQSDLVEMWLRWKRIAAIVATFMIVCLSLGLVLASRLQRGISEPILDLARKARAISSGKDYSIRAVRFGQDEIGILVDGFNEMLSEIESRDRERARLISAIEQSGDSIVLMDPFGRISYANQACGQNTSHRREVIVKGGLSGLYEGEKNVEALRKLHAAIDAEQPWSGRVKRVGHDNIAHDEEVMISPVRNEHGAIVSYVLTMRDVTELRLAKEAAEAANRTKSAFLANMSHEIRTPMNGIIGMTELALETKLDVQQREFLSVVKTSAESLLTLLNDVLDLSKIEAGKLQIDKHPFLVDELLGEAAQMVALKAHQKGLEVVCDIAPEVPDTICGDAGRLRQILVNLLGNAIKFTETGEVVVSAELEEAKGEHVKLHFAVRDTGIGIPAEKQAVIFEAFGQADASTTRRYGGTGLGLAISAHIVAMMNGRIWVESAPRRGSTFHFIVEFDKADPAASNPDPETIAALAGINTLVVDDNATNRKVLDSMLRTWRMNPALVEGGQAALTEMEAGCERGDAYRLVLLDVQMPEMDGFDVVAEIRRRPELAGAIVMMLTSGDQVQDAQRCRELCVQEYLIKPIRRLELRGAILRALGKQVAIAPSEAQEGAGSPPPARSLRILVAEDNPVNQKLALRLLRKEGHEVEMAADGTEAIRLYSMSEFDVVLMDVQMPLMDGLEATRHIRSLEKRTGKHVPIIAMTAHAMKGDRERCLDAGMDNYLTKPVRKAELLKAISSTQERPEPTVTAESKEAAASEVLNRNSALELLGGDEQLLLELSETFLEQSPQLISSVREALQGGRADEISRLAHKIKGSVSVFSASKAVSAALRLEQIGKSKDLSQADEAFDHLTQELARLGSELTAISEKQRHGLQELDL